MRAIWSEATIPIDRELIDRTEEYITQEGISYIQFDDIELSKAKYMANGIDMTSVNRVISTKNDVLFKIGDNVTFSDETRLNGEFKKLKIIRIEYKLTDKQKKTLEMFPQLKNKLATKVLFLK